MEVKVLIMTEQWITVQAATKEEAHAKALKLPGVVKVLWPLLPDDWAGQHGIDILI